MSRLQILIGSLVITFCALGISAFNSPDFHSASDIRCFKFANLPVTVPNVINNLNYSPAAGPGLCVVPPERYCMICFDASAYPEYLDANGKLNFVGNASLVAVVAGRCGDPTKHGTTNLGVTMYFQRL